MNNKIKELLLEAGIKFDKDTSEIDVCVMLPSDLEKFAELIIKECVTLMENEKAMYSDPGTYESREYYERMAAKEDAFGDAASAIKYHFGVK